jgi:hypothetical protein
LGSFIAVDEITGRKFTLDEPDDIKSGEGLTFILNLHGGGSVGMWQHEYFPAYRLVDKYRLIVATPSAATREPSRHWVAEADDEHLQNIVNYVVARYGRQNVRSFWLAGHSQGGGTSHRLLQTPFFKERVDGFLSLSGGRIGPAERTPNFGSPGREGRPPPFGNAARQAQARLPPGDLSFIYETGSHEILSLPETSPWAEKYGAGPRQRLSDVVDEEPGLIYDTRGDTTPSTPAWGFHPRPGTAQVYVYPNAREGRMIADVVRLDKGHTEGLEPKITEALVKMMVDAPGGKLQKIG